MAIDFHQRPRYAGTNLPLASETAPIAHVGAGGTSEHPAGTTSLAGFLATADKTKLDKFNTNSYYWHYYQSTAQSNLVNSTTGSTRLTFTSILGAGYDGGGFYSTAASGFTAQVTGLYLVGGGAFIATGTAPTAGQEIRLYASIADALNYVVSHKTVMATSGTYAVQGPIVLPATAGDVITLRLWHNLAGTGASLPDTVIGSGTTHFWGMFLRSL